MTLTNNHAQATMKQNNTNTDYLRGRSVFVFIANKLGPFEEPFHKLELHVSAGFSAFGFVLSLAFSCLETLMKHSPSLMKYCIFTV